MQLRFGDCVFDPEARVLLCDGQERPLSPKAFLLLTLLVEHRPKALSKTEIHDRLWPKTFVSDSSLARLVAEVRGALGDDARDPRFVRTLHGYGYALVPGVGQDGLPQRASGCRLVWAGREIPLGEGEHVVGRSEDAPIRIDSTRVSRHHACIRIAGGRGVLEDLGSKNGTFHRGTRIERPVTLTNGDEIVIGPVLLTYHEGPSESTDTDTDVR